MKGLMIACLMAMALVFGGSVRAADEQPAAEKPAKPAKDKAPKAADKVAKVKGAIVSVAADGKITIKVGKKDAAKDVVVETNDKTVVVIEGTASKVSDLKAGQQVVVSPAEGVASRIEVPVPKAKAPKDPKTPKTPKAPKGGD